MGMGQESLLPVQLLARFVAVVFSCTPVCYPLGEGNTFRLCYPSPPCGGGAVCLSRSAPGFTALVGSGSGLLRSAFVSRFICYKYTPNWK